MEATLATAAGRVHRVTLLDAPEHAPLEAYRRAVAARFGPVPHLDPLDGGTTAELLVLLETPGPRGPPPRFVSRDNSGGTARNLARFLLAAGLGRERTVLWNAVPWIIHAEGARNRAPRRAEIAAGMALLPDFLALLPRLRAIVMAGRVAQAAAPVLRAAQPELPLIAMPHPSPTYVNTSPAVALRIEAALAEARAYLDSAADQVRPGPSAARTAGSSRAANSASGS